MKRTITLFAVLLLAMTLAACGGGSDSGSEGEASPPAGDSAPAAIGESVDVSATEFAFDPAELSAPADTDVTVNLTNNGSVEHDWVIRDQDVKAVATPGQTGTATFNLPAGAYTFYCSIPGHEAAGMVGTLTVG